MNKYHFGNHSGSFCQKQHPFWARSHWMFTLLSLWLWNPETLFAGLSKGSPGQRMVRENASVIKIQKGEPEIAKKRGFYLGVPQVAFSCSREGWHLIKAQLSAMGTTSLPTAFQLSLNVAVKQLLSICSLYPPTVPTHPYTDLELELVGIICTIAVSGMEWGWEALTLFWFSWLFHRHLMMDRPANRSL